MMSPEAAMTRKMMVSDDFMLYEFKVLPCTRKGAHSWTECPYTHPGEKASRRCPRKHVYAAEACPDARKSGKCIRGDACPYSHGVFEQWLHPSRYRTQLCSFGVACRRPVCFFAHTVQELRAPAGADSVVGAAAQQQGSSTNVAPSAQDMYAAALALAGGEGAAAAAAAAAAASGRQQQVYMALLQQAALAQQQARATANAHHLDGVAAALINQALAKAAAAQHQQQQHQAAAAAAAAAALAAAASNPASLMHMAQAAQAYQAAAAAAATAAANVASPRRGAPPPPHPPPGNEPAAAIAALLRGGNSGDFWAAAAAAALPGDSGGSELCSSPTNSATASLASGSTDAAAAGSGGDAPSSARGSLQGEALPRLLGCGLPGMGSPWGPPTSAAAAVPGDGWGCLDSPLVARSSNKQHHYHAAHGSNAAATVAAAPMFAHGSDAWHSSGSTTAGRVLGGWSGTAFGSSSDPCYAAAAAVSKSGSATGSGLMPATPAISDMYGSTQGGLDGLDGGAALDLLASQLLERQLMLRTLQA